jgi:putative chitinase
LYTPERLASLCPHARKEIIAAVAPALEQQGPEFEISTLLRRAHLVAQLAHESGGFAGLEESLDYTPPRIAAVWPRLSQRAAELAHHPEALANAAYAHRLGNGGEESGDGWRYRGRGLIQLTGRDNYAARGEALGIDLVDSPDGASEPGTAVRIALSFWQTRQCNELADLDDIEAITRKINGPALLGLAARRDLAERAKLIFIG